MDSRTIDAARQGNEAAQAELLRHLQDLWYRMCLSMLRDPEKARDATQETALRFLKQLRTYRGDAKLSTWSLGIAINVCRESRRIRLHASTDADDAAPIEQNAPGPSDLAISSENESLVRSLLEHLPDRQREAVILRFFEELSVEETAKAMDCAQGTVKATIHQALRTLKKEDREAFMTPLRKQLEAARDRHCLAKYPGNLAADVLPRQRGIWWRALFVGGAAGAVAAGVALFIFLRSAPVPTPAFEDPQQVTSLTVPPRPELPEGFNLVPPAYDFSAAPACPEIIAKPDDETSRPEFPSRFTEL